MRRVVIQAILSLNHATLQLVRIAQFALIVLPELKLHIFIFYNMKLTCPREPVSILLATDRQGSVAV